MTDLRKLAEAATQGPWTIQREGGGRGGGWWSIRFDPEKAVAWKVCTRQDAAFMAAANPTAILALLKERDALRLALTEVSDVALAERDALKAENERLRKDARCTSEDPATGYRCEFKLGHGSELHSYKTFAWPDA